MPDLGLLVMVNFMYHLGWALRCPDIWSYIILGAPGWDEHVNQWTWAKQMALHRVRKPHPISWRPDSNKKTDPLLGKREFCSCDCLWTLVAILALAGLWWDHQLSLGLLNHLADVGFTSFHNCVSWFIIFLCISLPLFLSPSLQVSIAYWFCFCRGPWRIECFLLLFYTIWLSSPMNFKGLVPVCSLSCTQEIPICPGTASTGVGVLGLSHLVKIFTFTTQTFILVVVPLLNDARRPWRTIFTPFY